MCKGSSVSSCHLVSKGWGSSWVSRLLSQRGWEAEHVLVLFQRVTFRALGPF